MLLYAAIHEFYGFLAIHKTHCFFLGDYWVFPSFHDRYRSDGRDCWGVYSSEKIQKELVGCDGYEFCKRSLV